MWALPSLVHEFINMHGGYYFSLPEEVQRGEPSETRETQFRSCNCPGTRRKHQVFVPLLLGPQPVVFAQWGLRIVLQGLNGSGVLG